MRHAVRRSVRALVVISMLALAVPANAAILHDPPYAQGPLDLEWLEAHKHDAGAPLHIRIVTYGHWRSTLLAETGRNRIWVLFNPARAVREQFVGEVFFRDGDLWMRIRRVNGDFVRLIRVFHPRADTVTTVVPHGLPNPDGQSWLAAEEDWYSDGHCADGCHDRAPGTGWLKVTPAAH